MCLQVRRLLIDFSTFWDVTDVQSLLSKLHGATAGLAVGAFAAPAAARGAQQAFGGTLEEGSYLRLVAQNQLSAQREGVIGGGGIGLG